MSSAASRSVGLVAELPPAPAGVFDEYLSGTGAPREHQKLLNDFVRGASPQDLERLVSALRQRIAAQEVTFNILGAPDGSNRPWQLDLLPLVIERSRWSRLSEGLVQRARVLSAVYADLYGERRLIREGVIPAQLVLGNPDFARACCGYVPLGGHRLHLYACDVGADAQGEFQVYSDRVAAPAGSGYALENRLALGGVLSGLFNDYGVQRLRRFFSAVDECVHSLVRPIERQARVVVLSPGLSDESAFEHAYLTRYWGYELVEGRDLTVRDRVVYLKTLSGLKKVDLVIRRVHDRFCDPVRLREDSTLGVAGLVEAAAAGNVVLLNPLGIGALEAPGFKPYLDAASRFFFGDGLSLPSVETHYCGDRAALAHARGHLEELVFKPALLERSGPVVRPALLSAGEREEFLERLDQNPGAFVAERWSGLSLAPVLENGSLRRASVALRTFLCRRDDDYLVMPGGVARSDVPPDGLFLTGETERASKDVWISSGAQLGGRSPPSMPDGPIELRRGGLELPSRLLDDLYWLGRYIERADVAARLLRSAFDRLNGEAPDDAQLGVSRIVDALRATETLPASDPTEADTEGLLLTAVFDAGTHTTLHGLMRSVHALSRRTRSWLSRSTWQTMHQLIALFQPVEARGVREASEVIDRLLILLASLRGATLDNMVRSHAWRFLDMGRRVERGTMMLTVVRAMLAPGAARVHMELLLESADSLLTYRSRYLSRLQVAPVVDLLVTDDTNPRSVVFQASELANHVEALPRLEDRPRSRAQRRIIALQSSLLSLDVAQACSASGAGLRSALETASGLFWEFSDDVEQAFFSHTVPLRALASAAWINEDLEA